MDWIKLVNYGEFQHSKGMQCVTINAAKKIVDNFHSLCGKISRKFYGLPIYIGHPDDEDFRSENNTIYGRVEDVKCNDVGIWILIKWSPLGRKIFESGTMSHLSPRWAMKEVDAGVFEPQKLLSVGLTNRPNIRCEHDVQKDTLSSDNVLSQILKLFEIDENLREEDILDRMKEIRSSIDSEEKIPQQKDDDEDIKTSSDDCSKSAASSICVQDAEEDGRLNKIKLNMESKTGELVNRGNDISQKERILKLVYDRMSTMNESYHTAWLNTKIQFPELFK